MKLRRWLATADSPTAEFVRRLHRSLLTFGIPAPRILLRPALAIFIALRAVCHTLVRVFICEPLFKAYCTQYGRRVCTGSHLHWVQGRGKLIVGDEVLIDGKSSFTFATRYTDSPELLIGSHTIVGHGCTFTVGRRISIGQHCMLASGVILFDAPGHPNDPELRKAGAPAPLEDVRPIEIEDNVWIGMRAMIFPGVRIGTGTVVTAGSIVASSVPAHTIVAGNPARVIGSLKSCRPASIQETAADLKPKSESGQLALERVMQMLRRTLETPDLAPDEDFYDAGLTSIMVLQLLVEIEETFGVPESQNEELLTARTGKELAAALDKLAYGIPSNSQS